MEADGEAATRGESEFKFACASKSVSFYFEVERVVAKMRRVTIAIDFGGESPNGQKVEL